MIWLPKSIMHTRGVAGGEVGQTHELSEDRQGEFQYTIGPYADPVLQIEPGIALSSRRLTPLGAPLGQKWISRRKNYARLS
jgi:hypothetical protein